MAGPEAENPLPGFAGGVEGWVRGAAAVGEFAHVDGKVVLFENFAAEEVLEDVLHGDDAGHEAVFVDDDGHLLVVFEELLEGGGGGGGLGDEDDGLHEAGDGELILVGRLGFEKVAAADDADDVVEAGVVNREAGEGDVGEVAKDVGHGAGFFQRGDDDAGGHHVADVDVVEFEGVGDEVAFLGGEVAVVGLFFGEEGDFVGGGAGGRGFTGEELEEQAHQPGEGTGGEAHGLKDDDEAGVEADAVEDADVFGEDFAEDEDAEGHADSKGVGLVGEEAGGEGAADEGAEGVGDGVEGEDGGDAFLEAVAAPGEEGARAGGAGLEGLDLGDGGTEEHGLDGRAESRDHEGENDGEEEFKHDRPPFARSALPHGSYDISASHACSDRSLRHLRKPCLLRTP
jgi:hypothetical protein